jgi:hypothetical protein
MQVINVEMDQVILFNILKELTQHCDMKCYRILYGVASQAQSTFTAWYQSSASDRVAAGEECQAVTEIN